MKESDIQTALTAYLQENAVKYEMMVYELKIVKDKRFAFNQVKEHQINYLLKAEEGFSYKIIDPPFMVGRGASKRPFDGVLFRCKSYVAICFWEKNRKKIIHFVRTPKYLILKDDSKKKSCHESDIVDVSEFSINLLKRA